ncbi:hypothetical protein GMOD_00001600 [Pyrenophora seminiperda CCB06]|uniref:Uncharacterized protein n=1 Tax=Pyrenophora seminiperda CCB06 TaxID=1302712 RepID=A0A3M7LZE8_9PLEO|nr:hypothetical protein GMOD_00001600 [Pyrenophora seminiperda CCB06]
MALIKRSRRPILLMLMKTYSMGIGKVSLGTAGTWVVGCSQPRAVKRCRTGNLTDDQRTILERHLDGKKDELILQGCVRRCKHLQAVYGYDKGQCG